ncbi:MAG: hypothetical protein US70_C0018G0003 [Parcubacteria group bacterium GW2011_GWD2_38_11]|nr:MAG: hypothetical protein US70_C0018G0003 [Parcubacteria group bacterium GW2011_GWD2_38_11]
MWSQSVTTSVKIKSLRLQIVTAKKANKMKKEKLLIPYEMIEQKIYLIRGKKVMFDSDLALLYGVETKALKRSTKRNIDRFPEDFMFQLNNKEAEVSRYQFGTLKRGQNVKYLPYVFTEQGVAMLSGILNSKRAIEVNVQIIRTFVKLREMIISNKELRIKMEDMERKYDKRFKVVFDTLRSLVANNKKEISIEKKEAIGFKNRKK